MCIRPCYPFCATMYKTTLIKLPRVLISLMTLQSFFYKFLLSIPRRLHVGYDTKVENPVATVVLLHGLGCTHEVWEPLKPKIPDNVRVISLDLLGFGDSPKPRFSAYSNKVQAKSIAKTLRIKNATKNLIIVGHSMGSLIAIDLARQKPDWIKHMLLCGPPIYRPQAKKGQRQDREKILEELYDIAAKTFEENPDEVLGLAATITRLGLAPRSIELTSETIKPYIASLRTSIIDQDTYATAKNITVPTALYYGRFDPLVVHENIANIAKNNQHITTKRFLSSHALSGSYLRRIARDIRRITSQD